jgi:hypothetical protein
VTGNRSVARQVPALREQTEVREAASVFNTALVNYIAIASPV